METNGRQLLPGFRLKRLEMLVGVNGTGKSTAADALRTLLVPPVRATYNDSSIDHKLKHTRRDRTKKTYIRGAYGSSSQEDSATALTQFLRPGWGRSSRMAERICSSQTRATLWAPKTSRHPVPSADTTTSLEKHGPNRGHAE